MGFSCAISSFLKNNAIEESVKIPSLLGHYPGFADLAPRIPVSGKTLLNPVFRKNIRNPVFREKHPNPRIPENIYISVNPWIQ